jgi:2-keto-3-deoxy-L-fuconate dehydrogenase
VNASADRDARVAIVTGGARGIGAAIAAELRSRGMTVVTLDIRALDGAENGAGGLEHLVADVSDSAAVSEAVRRTIDAHGRIDVLVNNAGIIDVHSVHDTPEDVWDRVLAVNLTSVYLMSRAVIPHLRDSGGGSIVNVTSAHALATVPRAAAYAASKGAILSLSRQMALDYFDEGIRVNALVVGSVDTDMSTAHGAALARDGIRTADPTGEIGRMGTAAEIAKAAAFLTSPDASFVTGSPFIVDGGLLARLM